MYLKKISVKVTKVQFCTVSVRTFVLLFYFGPGSKSASGMINPDQDPNPDPFHNTDEGLSFKCKLRNRMLGGKQVASLSPISIGSTE